MKNFIIVCINIVIASNCIGQNFFEKGFNEYYSGDLDKSIEYFGKAISQHQETKVAYMLRGAAKGFKGDFTGAIEDLNESLKLDSTNYKLYYYYGKVYLLFNNYDLSLDYLNKANRINPGDADTYNERAIVKIKLEKFSSAIDDENDAIRLDSTNFNFYNNRGYAKAQLEEHDRAIEDYTKSLKLFESPKAFANRGQSYYEKGAYELAVVDFSNSLSLNPNDNIVFLFRGKTLLKLDRKENACSDFNKSFQLGNSSAKKMIKKYCDVH